jgi:hypothetical protein
MTIKLETVATALNTLAAIGATLQATGMLTVLGPTGIAIFGAILAAVNAIAHQINVPATPAAPLTAVK